MCFSPEADLAAGLVVGVFGVDALRPVRRPRDLALASLPGLFAAHQVSEAFVWWGLTDRVAWSTSRMALWLYLGFAFVVLPVLLPLAVRAVEPVVGKRRWLGWLAALGLALAVACLAAMWRGPISAEIDGHRIVYDLSISNRGLLGAVYFLVVCGALLASSHESIVAFGVANVGLVGVLLWMSVNELTSLWCVWAALTSVAIAVHLRRALASTENRPEVRRASITPRPPWRRRLPTPASPGPAHRAR